MPVVLRTSRPSLRLIASAALLALAVPLGGCGSSSKPPGTSASPATVTPASAPLFLDAVVRPEGALKSDAASAASTLTRRAKPFEGLLKLLAGPAGRVPNYSSEVAPWLGTRAGVFLGAADLSRAGGLLGSELLKKALSEGLTGLEASLLGSGGLPALLGARGADGALVLDTSDVGKARAFLESQGRAAGARTVAYRGISYSLSSSGVAEGIVQRFAVIGSEAGFKSVVDTASGGPPLTQLPAYSTLVSTAESGSLADVWFSPEALGRSAQGGGGSSANSAAGGGASVLPLLLGVLGNPRALYLSVVPSANSLALNLDTLPSPAGAGGGTTGAEVLRGLPGGAWLALGVGDLSKTFGNSASGLGALASLASGVSLGSISLGPALAPLRSRSLNVQRDLLSWTGAAGVYVSGSSVLALQAALVVTSKNPSLSRAAVAKIAAAYREAGGQTAPTSVPGTETAVTVKLPNFPLTLTMAAGQGKFVIGVGAASVQEALSPQTTLAGSPAYNAAAAALGQGIQPSVLVEFHTLSGLLESLGLNQAPGFSGFASAIAPLNNLAVGGGESLSGGVKRARVVVGLQAPEAQPSG
jgi:Protein of unknown function (DUF3352)